MARRKKETEALKFLYRNYAIMMDIYRLLKGRGVPPSEARLMFLALAEIEGTDPHDDDSYEAAVERVLQREQGRSQ